LKNVLFRIPFHTFFCWIGSLKEFTSFSRCCSYSWTSRKRPPKMSSGLIREVVAYGSLDHNGSRLNLWANADAMFYSCKSQFWEKYPIFPFEKFPFLVLPRHTIMLPTLLSILRSIIRQLVAYGRLKTKKNFKLLTIKVVVVAYERWSLTRGSKYSDLTCKLWVFWTTGCWGEFVAYVAYCKFIADSWGSEFLAFSFPKVMIKIVFANKKESSYIYIEKEASSSPSPHHK